MFLNRSTYLSNAEVVANKRRCCCATPATSRRVLLFAGNANSAVFKNSWEGWLKEGVPPEGGKTTHYDNTHLSMLELRDSTGTYAIYDLTTEYKGKTMLEIAKTEGELSGGSTGSADWNDGLAIIGTLVDFNVHPDTRLSTSLTEFDENLRMGVGDGTNNRGGDHMTDWVFLFPLTGNCNTDFTSCNPFAFGSESSLSNHRVKKNGGFEFFTGRMELIGHTAN